MYRATPYIRSYAHAEQLWKTVRSPKKGKPVSARARLFKRDDGTFEIFDACYGSGGKPMGNGDIYGEGVYATLSPDNVLTLTKVVHKSIWLHYIFPLVLYRNKISYPYKVMTTTKQYRMGLPNWQWPRTYDSDTREWGVNQAAKASNAVRRKMLLEQPDLFPGIQIDLNSGEVLNPKPRLVVNPTKRKEFSAKVKRLMTMVKTMDLMKAFPPQQMTGYTSPAGHTHQMPVRTRWDKETFSKLFAAADEGYISAEVAQMLSNNGWDYYRHKSAESKLNNLLRQNEYVIRRVVGVLEEEKK